MPLRIPPHIGWPLFIIGLLSISIFAASYTFVKANSGGGAQVVEDYYQRALDWDEEVTRRQNAERMGWHLAVTASDTVQNDLRAIYLDITDSDGHAVNGVRGTVRAYRPHLSNVVAEVPLVAVSEQPGRYMQMMPAAQTGLWDFELRARTEGDPVFMKTRIEIRK